MPESAGVAYDLPMGMEASGRIHATMETQQITERFRKREFVVELADNPRYPQFVLFQLTGDRCESLDGFEVGQEVRVEFSLQMKEDGVTVVVITHRPNILSAVDKILVMKDGTAADFGPAEMIMRKYQQAPAQQRLPGGNAG